MRATSALLLVTLWLAGLFLAVHGLATENQRIHLGTWTGGSTVEAAERAPDPATQPSVRNHLLSGPTHAAAGPFRADPERHRTFLRRLLLPERARALDATGEALLERQLLDYFLDRDPAAASWDEPPLDPETVS